VPASVVVRGGPVVFRVELSPRRYTPFALAESLEEAAEIVGRGYPEGLPVELVRAVRGAAGPAGCTDPDLRRVLESAGLTVRAPGIEEERAAVAALPAPRADEERAFLLLLARERVRVALGSDEEALIALAREEERVERAVLRERGAAEQFLADAAGPLAEYAEDWEKERAVLAEHHARLFDRLETVAGRTVPNLSRLVGTRVAARLVALAGSRAALARVSASRLQLLGSRRRPGGGRGPRFGVIYRAARLTDVPRDRQGRYARSLAAMASIAARADAITHRDLGDSLVLRRDRRIDQLRRRP
jgi:snoRNA binding domain-containing protein (fibrillarin)